MTLPDPPAAVLDVINASGDPARLMEMRALIYEVADATGTGPLTETLKWGEPAYLPAKKAGTTIRLGATETSCAVYVNCQTTLLESYRERFPGEFDYEGNRAVRITKGAPLNKEALAQVFAMALTYHRDKRAKTLA